MINPFYSVFLEGNEKIEITDFVQSFSYNHSVKKDSVLTLKIYSEKVNSFESNNIERGKYLQIQYGYKSGEVSNFYSLRISDVQYRYAEKIEITVTATDKGNVMKKSTSKKIWKNKTTGDICKEIAAKYGLDYVGDYEGIRWNNLLQAGKNDFEFLQETAEKEKDGNFIVFVSGNTLFFVKRGLDKDSTVMYRYGSPKSNIISFIPKEKETTLTSEDVKVSTNVEEETIEPDENNKVTLGKFEFTYNANGEDIATNLGKSLNLPDPDKKIAKNRLKTVQNKGKLKGLTATLRIIGSPLLTPNEIISISGVRTRHIGNYLIEEIKHTIDVNGGYITTLELNRNGQETGSKLAENVNKKIGEETAEEKKVSIYVFDADGNQIGESNGSEYKKL